MTGNKLITTLYKAFYKLALKYDKNVPAKAMLYRLPPSSSSADSVFRSAPQIHFNGILDKILGRQRLFYHPSRMDQSLKAIVRKEFRNNKSKVSLNSRIDVGFSLLRQLSALWVTYEQEVQYRVDIENMLTEHRASITDTESDKKVSSKKKKSVSSKPLKLDATTAPVTIQPGVIVAAHPMVHGDMHRTLVLIVEHNEEYTYGVVLNKAQADHSSPAWTVRSGVSGLRVKGFYDAFGDNPLFFGGNVRRLSHMHANAECAGIPVKNAKTTTPLFMHGSIEKAIAFVNEQDSPSEAAEQFYFFAGACYWEPGQLQTQVGEGTWFPIIAPVDELLQLTLRDCEKATGDESFASIEKEISGDAGSTKCSESSVSDSGSGERRHSLFGEAGDSFGGVDEVEDEEREKLNRVWAVAMRSASRNSAQLAALPFSLHSAAVEPLVWTGDDYSAY